MTSPGRACWPVAAGADIGEMDTAQITATGAAVASCLLAVARVVASWRAGRVPSSGSSYVA